jgi:Tfp pilus assembly protein PilN
MVNPLKKYLHKERVVFACQFIDGYFKIVKVSAGQGAARIFLSCAKENIAGFPEALAKLGYRNHPLIISLARSQATLRFLKVPSQDPREIERIVRLQAPTLLPYPAEELITGYQNIFTDRQGFANVNLIIVHRDALQKNLSPLKGLSPKEIKLALSSYGLCNLAGYLVKEAFPLMLIDLDCPQIELAIIKQDKLLFSRCLKIDLSSPGAVELLINEIRKTRDAYLKEISAEEPVKIFLTGPGREQKGISDAIKQNLNLAVEYLDYPAKIIASGEFAASIAGYGASFASIIGLALKEIPEPLNLIPQQEKDKAKEEARFKEYLRKGALICGIALLFLLAARCDLQNKRGYLRYLKGELKKIEKEARPLEEAEARIKLLEGRSKNKNTPLKLLYELHRCIPSEISLSNLSYDEKNQLILRGLAPGLDALFSFVAELEKSPFFKGLDVKVRYATQKKVQSGEVVDFELVCLAP